jgi:hypothetical protein
MTDPHFSIVSFESNREDRNNPKIKIIANEFNVKCITLFEMMIQLKISI